MRIHQILPNISAPIMCTHEQLMMVWRFWLIDMIHVLNVYCLPLEAPYDSYSAYYSIIIICLHM